MLYCRPFNESRHFGALFRVRWRPSDAGRRQGTGSLAEPAVHARWVGCIEYRRDALLPVEDLRASGLASSSTVPIRPRVWYYAPARQPTRGRCRVAQKTHVYGRGLYSLALTNTTRRAQHAKQVFTFGLWRQSSTPDTAVRRGSAIIRTSFRSAAGLPYRRWHELHELRSLNGAGRFGA